MHCYKCKKTISFDEKPLSGLHEACFMEWFNLSKPLDFVDVISRSSSNKSGLSEHSSFFHGKFKKYSARLNEKNYILKVQEDDFPELPATEYLCNELARHLGLDVPNFFLLRFQSSLETFVCENFIQTPTLSTLIHIYHFLGPSPENFTCEALSHAIIDKTQRMEDVERFVELTLFDALIGNHDRHGRNIALIQSTGGLRLSPFYDNPSYLSVETESFLGARHEPSGQVYTAHSREPKMSDYVKEWKRLGQMAPVNNFRERIVMDELMEIIESGCISPKRKKALQELVGRRYVELMS